MPASPGDLLCEIARTCPSLPNANCAAPNHILGQNFAQLRVCGGGADKARDGFDELRSQCAGSGDSVISPKMYSNNHRTDRMYHRIPISSCSLFRSSAVRSSTLPILLTKNSELYRYRRASTSQVHVIDHPLTQRLPMVVST